MSASDFATLAISSLLMVLGAMALRWRWLVDRTFDPAFRIRLRSLNAAGYSKRTSRYQETLEEVESTKRMLRRRVPYILVGLGILLIATVFLR